MLVEQLVTRRSSMSDNSALLARIAELEAQLAQTTIQETVDAKAADAAARTGGSRATEGTAKTISSKGKIGGEFQVTANPAFLAERLSIFEKLKANYKGRVEALPHEPITVTMPDGKVWAGEAISWKTTPMDIAKSISNSLAKNCVVADVRYTGTRYAMGEKVTNAEEELVEAEADVKVQGELWDLNRPLEGDCELHLIKFGVRACMYRCMLSSNVLPPPKSTHRAHTHTPVAPPPPPRRRHGVALPAHFRVAVKRYLQCCLPPEVKTPVQRQL